MRAGGSRGGTGSRETGSRGSGRDPGGGGGGARRRRRGRGPACGGGAWAWCRAEARCGVPGRGAGAGQRPGTGLGGGEAGWWGATAASLPGGALGSVTLPTRVRAEGRGNLLEWAN